nr:MAG TPA: hypothetical protein [Caudoviricetes sp.]
MLTFWPPFGAVFLCPGFAVGGKTVLSKGLPEDLQFGKQRFDAFPRTLISRFSNG